MEALTTPVLFVVFNRLDTVRKSFEAIRAIRPASLYISADGPRRNHPGEARQCDEVRRFILDKIDWPCRLETCFREENLGCGCGVRAAIDWFFSEVDEGIILEDDCVADPDFFRFAHEMLERYRDDRRIMHISGDCFFPPLVRGEEDYFFMRYPMSWGWATWRRAWELCDFKMANFPAFCRERIIEDVFCEDHRAQKRWLEIFNAIYTHDPIFDAWDFQWLYANLCHHGLSVNPIRNLVSNIGIESTHWMPSKIMFTRTSGLNSYTPPAFMVPDVQYEQLIFANIFARPSFVSRLRRKIIKYLRWI